MKKSVIPITILTCFSIASLLGCNKETRCTVQFNALGGQIVDHPEGYSIEVQSGTKWQDITPPTAEKYLYNFFGWSLDDSGKGHLIDSKYVIDSNLTLYGSYQLKPAPSPAINYDHDYDGIIDELDPAPEDNNYQVQLTLDDGYSPAMPFMMDYRNFLKDEYDSNLGLLGAYFINEFASTEPVFSPAYSPIADPASKVMAQIGCQDITYIDVSSQYQSSPDPYDVDDIVMGHNIFVHGNQYYQVIFANNYSYVLGSNEGFMSNFDIGADTNAYQEFLPSEHPDWNDKNDHKGFGVTANRILKAVLQYYEDHKIEGTKPIFFVTGHSRGGAITNLIARSLIDEGYMVRAYAYNTPNNTTLLNASDDRYKTIFNILNDDDLVSLVPTIGMGFHRFGQDISVPVSAYAEQYKTFFGKEYHCCGLEAINAVADTLNAVCTRQGACNRNNVYEYRDHHIEGGVDLDAEYFATDTDALTYHNILKAQIDSYSLSSARNSLHVEGVRQTLSGEYCVSYSIRPSILFPIAWQVMELPEMTIWDVLTIVYNYTPFIDTLLSDVLNTITPFFAGDFDGLANAHIQATSCFMVYMHNQED